MDLWEQNIKFMVQQVLVIIKATTVIIVKMVISLLRSIELSLLAPTLYTTSRSWDFIYVRE
ncbi:unnamed protein product [Linum tenue]|uniref:Uncharacterized protein n=1 Tax=Linum tenue TaxID=586396 RepID=A0AAV0NN61_9ROSI|nr:unnamed protein product [Linum tenue]